MTWKSVLVLVFAMLCGTGIIFVVGSAVDRIDNPTEEQPEQSLKYLQSHSDIRAFSGGIQYIELEDGTRCVLLSDRAIDCNWQPEAGQ